MWQVQEPGSFPLCVDSRNDVYVAQRLRQLVEHVSRLDGSLRPAGLILTGSFARGEGTIQRSAEQGVRWLSDIECIAPVTARGRTADPAQTAALARIASEVERDSTLSSKALKIQISAIPAARLVKMRPAIFTYELATHGKLLWGDAAQIPIPGGRIPPVAPPRADAFRLLNNRIIEHLAARAALEARDQPLAASVYADAKMWVELGTSLSVFLGAYSPSYRERANNLEGSLVLADQSLDRELAATILTRFRAAMALRQSADCRYEVSRSVLKESFTEAADAAARLWFWETEQLGCPLATPAIENWKQVPARLRRVQGPSQQARDWARLLVRTGVLRHVGWRGIAPLMMAGSFGNAIYAVGCLLEFFWHGAARGTGAGTDIMNTFGGLLQPGARSAEFDRERFVARVFETWQLHLRDSPV